MTPARISSRLLISIHALLAESDGKSPRRCVLFRISIHALLAESDLVVTAFPGSVDNFYPRSPCGERHLDNIEITQAKRISIHALLAESDTALLIQPIRRPDFYPRSPCGERRGPGQILIIVIDNFYPRSPCGERLNKRCKLDRDNRFLSTLSLRRATDI